MISDRSYFDVCRLANFGNAVEVLDLLPTGWFFMGFFPSCLRSDPGVCGFVVGPGPGSRLTRCPVRLTLAEADDNLSEIVRLRVESAVRSCKQLIG